MKKRKKKKGGLKYIGLISIYLVIIACIYYGVILLQHLASFKDILAVIIIYLGIVDGWKYLRQKQKIVRLKSSKDISRLFSISAFVCNFGFLVYVVLIQEPVLIFVRAFSLYTTLDLYYHCYLYYPYKKRFKPTFKIPSLRKFIVNTFQSNNSKKRL